MSAVEEAFKDTEALRKVGFLYGKLSHKKLAHILMEDYNISEGHAYAIISWYEDIKNDEQGRVMEWKSWQAQNLLYLSVRAGSNPASAIDKDLIPIQN